MNTASIAVIGDHFMKPEMFAAALQEMNIPGSSVRTLQLDWPDTPMVHGYAGDELEGLKEYLGDPEDILSFIDDARILINHLAPVSRAMLERLPSLELIAVSRGGPVNIDMQAARSRDIRVVNTPGRNASAVAEFTIAMVLAQTRLITAGHDALRQSRWRGDLYRADRTGEELCEMTVGIVGYGHIGTKVVRLLKPFGCRILVCDPYVQLDPQDAADGVKQVDLEELLSTADVVSLHPRVTDETRGMIDASALSRMKPGSYLINTARGPLVDYEALYEALVSGHLWGAGLETFAVEPVPEDSPLLELENVTLTPHIAGASVKTVKHAAAMAAEEVRRFLSGEPPLNPV